MSLDLNAATARLMRDIKKSETAVAEALVATASLMQSAAIAQRDVAGAPFVESHSIMLRLTKMTATLVEVQAETRRAHGQLLKIGQEMGATEEPTCPDNVFTSAEGQAFEAA